MIVASADWLCAPRPNERRQRNRLAAVEHRAVFRGEQIQTARRAVDYHERISPLRGNRGRIDTVRDRKADAVDARGEARSRCANRAFGVGGRQTPPVGGHIGRVDTRPWIAHFACPLGVAVSDVECIDDDVRILHRLQNRRLAQRQERGGDRSARTADRRS